MADTNRTVEFVSRLVRLSQEDRIKWRPVPPSRGDKNYSAFQAKIGGRNLRIEETTQEIEDPSSVFMLSTRVSPRLMTTSAYLDVLDEDGRVMYTLRNVAGLSDLFRSAGAAASGIEELIDSVLRKDDA